MCGERDSCKTRNQNWQIVGRSMCDSNRMAGSEIDDCGGLPGAVVGWVKGQGYPTRLSGLGVDKQWDAGGSLGRG